MRFDDSDESCTRKIDQLQKVSNFLNQFQSHFLQSSAQDDDSNEVSGRVGTETSKACVGDITTQDVEDALAFRLLTERLKTLEGEKFVVIEYGRNEIHLKPLTQKLTEIKDERIEIIKKEIETIPNRTKLVLYILRRFEVWTCKLIAHDHLLTTTRLLPESVRNKTDQCCFSPFINLPSSTYFARRLSPCVVDTKKQSQLASMSADRLGNDTATKSSISAFHRKKNCSKCCALALPPNKHTWEAYARLAVMASLIGDEESTELDHTDDNQKRVPSKNSSLIQCFKSPSCVYDLYRCKGKNPLHNHQYSFSASDLVPLWIRAQRNTQASRHLILLFEVKRESKARSNLSNSFKDTDSTSKVREDGSLSISGKNGKRHTLVDQAGLSSEKTDNTFKRDSLHFKAYFRGNPSNTRARVVDISELVDSLIEWAIANQLLFTYKRIRKQILASIIEREQKNRRKRQREVHDNITHTKICKKLSFGLDKKQELFELRQSCQSYLLRWFARRNRDALTVLFSKRIETLSFDIGFLVNTKVLSQVRVLKDANIYSRVQQYMQHYQSGKFYPEDRTLSRIDRRLFIENRYSGTSSITCESQVSTLLQMLSKGCPANQKSHGKLIDMAIEDYEHLFRTFSLSSMDEDNQDDICNLALKLVNPPQGCTIASLVDLLKSFPAPWGEKCCKCHRVEPAILHTCFNCEQVFHEKCSNSVSGSSCVTIPLKNFVNASPPLKNLLQLKQPVDLHYPNFSKSEDQWIKKTIRLERQLKGDGKVRKLGISFDHTEDCLKVLEAIESDACSLMELIKIEENDGKGKKLLAPVRLNHKGCLVREIHKDLCGGRAGLQVGDIIIGIEFVEYAHVEDERKYGGPCRFDMASLCRRDRLALLKVDSLKLNLIILRPPMNIVKIATAWYSAIQFMNKHILDILHGMDTLKFWYCGNCTQSEHNKESKTIFFEAANCRAVIRRIGMESYAKPVLEENQIHESDHFSLRRLDSIMTHIMRVETNQNVYDYARGAFFEPSSANSTPRRLVWATESIERQPMELLCKAMKTLMHSSFSKKSNLKTQLCALVRHFLVAFSSWCVGSTVKSKSFSQLKGPPDIFKYSRAPWFGTTCYTHHLKSTKYKIACLDPLSLSISQDKLLFEKINREEVEKAEINMKKYSAHSSLVGQSFLVLPGDPLVEYVSKIVDIEHENRPVEFVVASYLTSDYYEAVVSGRQRDHFDQFDESDGIYHLLPVVSSRQINFLLERCKMRNETKTDNFWTSLEVLNLEGVVRYSPAALQNKMKESNEIRLAIDCGILQQIRASNSTSKNSSPDLQPPTHYETAIMDTSSSVPEFSLAMQENLLETLLKSKSAVEVIRDMLSSDVNHDQNDTTGDDKDRPKWKIVQRDSDSESLDFGNSCLHSGLIAINASTISWRILNLDSISKEKYSLYYSDLLFQDEVGKEELRKTLYSTNILPFQDSGSSIKGWIKAITLSQQSPKSSCTDTFGWGFEIVKRVDEHILRVGRVRRQSPSDEAGLKTHDIIQSVNGVRFTRFRNISSFISSILGAPGISIRIPKGLDRNDEISIILSTIKNSKIKLSPVTFIVVRPSSSTRQLVQSERPVSLSQIPAQSHQKNVPRKNIPELKNGVSQNRLLPVSKPYAPRNNYAMITILRENYSRRPLIQKWDFYRPAMKGTILTALEVSVFLESIMNRTSKLGIRLLMPRYEIKTIAEQIRIIFSWTVEAFVAIPKVQGEIYQNLLHLDYERMNCKQFPETGPIILEEQNNGVKYMYRSPVRPLPIDRSIEIAFYAEKNQQQQWNTAEQRHGRGYSVLQQNVSQPNQINFYRINEFRYDKTTQDTTRNSHPGTREFYNLPQERNRTVDNHHSDSPYRRHEIQNNKLAVDLTVQQDVTSGVNEPTLLSEEPSLSVYLNESNDRKDDNTSEQLNEVNPCSSSIGQHAERIRGGGGKDLGESNDSTVGHQDNYLYLCDVPRDQWKGKAVYTFVQTASKGSICRDALLVGFVRTFIEASSRNEEIPDKVEIEAFYLSCTGYFETTKMHQSDSDEVWVVNIDQDCEEARVVAKLHSQNKLPIDYNEEFQRATSSKMVLEKNQKEHDRSRTENFMNREQEDTLAAVTQTLTTDSVPRNQQAVLNKVLNGNGASARCLQHDQIPYTYECEDQHFGGDPSIKRHRGDHECSLCSLPLERYLACNSSAQRSKPIVFRSLGCSLMSEIALSEQPSYLDARIPGRLGEAKIILLRIASLIPMSLKLSTKDCHRRVDPLLSFRIFDDEIHYALWKDFVAECTCTAMLAQAFVMLLASIERTKLPDWLNRKNAGWSTPYAVMVESRLSALYLHFYVLDAAISDVIAMSLNANADKANISHDAKTIQNERMKKFWKRAMAQGYNVYEGSHEDRCYYCNDGGHLLCCELCPKVQHHECCDPKLSRDVELDHWLCDSCINDIDNYDEAGDYEIDHEDDSSS